MNLLQVKYYAERALYAENVVKGLQYLSLSYMLVLVKMSARVKEKIHSE